MPDYVEDWTAFYEAQQAELENSDMSKEEMIAEIKKLLRNMKMTLPEYKRIQEPMRYQMTLEDVEIVEEHYREFVKDDVGIFERDDIIDVLVQARGKFRLIMDILERSTRGDWKRPE